MKLQLERPIAFLDGETTGIDKEKDRFVEIAVCKLHPSGQVETISKRVNPQIPIPEGATKVHGITDADVAGEPTFKQISKSLLAFLDGCDLAGFNSNAFDFPLLFIEFGRAGIDWDYNKHLMIDCCTIFKLKERRDLAAAVKFYCNRDLEGAHGAKADIEATVDVFISQMTKYENDPEFPQTLEELAIYSNYGKKVLDIFGNFYYDDQGEIRFVKGKHKDKVSKTEKGYLQWMLKATDPPFPADTIKIVNSLLSAK